MSGWISKDDLASRMGHKILIGGLSEAGKTAVKRIFFFKQKTTDVDRLAATIDYERMAISISDVRISIVDLGGQKVFIRRFLNKFSPFIFSSVHIFIFVIDVAARSTRNDAIKYFADCIERLQKYSPNAKYFVFLHKNDLVRQAPNYESVHAQLKEQFQLETQKKLLFFRTTIYDPKTVINAFGRIFEISVPEISGSEYVDGQIIGDIEEFAELYATSEIQDILCPKCGLSFSQTEEGLKCNFCDYIQPIEEISETDVTHLTASPTRNSSPVSLDTLKAQLQEVLVEDEEKEAVEISPTAPELTTLISPESEQSKNSVTFDTLQTQLQDLIIEEDSKAPQTAVNSDLIQNRISETYVEHTQQDSETEAEESIDPTLHTEFLTNFYGINRQQAEQIIERDYSRVFEASAKVGVPIRILLDVFFKYIPYLDEKGLSLENVENRLSEVFFAYLNKVINEDEIFRVLTRMTKTPHLAIEEIADTYLTHLREMEKQLEMEKAQIAALSLKDEADELPAGAITLSSTEKIGFKAIKIDYNCRLTFYQGKRELSTNLVPITISIRDLKYLLAFEVELPTKENYKEFIEKAAPLISNRISKLN